MYDIPSMESVNTIGAPERSTSALGADGALFEPAEVRSLRDQVYDDIRDAILGGALRPGQRVKERDVAGQMDVSTTPVKEALRRLEQEGFIVSQPRRGATVSPLVLTPPAEILQLRADLEGMAARLAAQKMNDQQRKALREQLEELRRSGRTADQNGEPLVAATARFHRLIIDAADNGFVSRFLSTLAPFDRTVLRVATIVRQEASRDAVEHAAICEAIQSGDGPSAEKLMHDHIERVVDDVFGPDKGT